MRSVEDKQPFQFHAASLGNVQMILPINNVYDYIILTYLCLGHLKTINLLNALGIIMKYKDPEMDDDGILHHYVKMFNRNSLHLLISLRNTFLEMRQEARRDLLDICKRFQKASLL